MENAIKIQLPLSVSYPALEAVLQQQLVGQYIPKPEDASGTPPYAQILDIGIAKSSTGSYDVMLRVKIRILRTVLKRDEVELYVLATLGYDNTAEQLFVRKFNVVSRTSSGFYNTALEVLANKVAYSQILKRASINLGDIVAQELKKANVLLEEGLELKGATLTGKVESVLVQDITPHPGKLSLLLELKGNVAADVFDLLSLMPAKQEQG
ncbi:DUF4403 family protein [Pontibacter actiniarum]|uniref:DUF4403 domain-containing protein n=1 Tax=Pontibacter actiniarum TaxID=323450 RepID=A0A1X9YN33_9BACT|nr:DUF4403 family protein [Pontibacter actiniarum]ARS34306.1 hypothetical protein CA264_01980 [Pontibacter actiniarum]